jgi:hypothetical protein
MLLPINPAPPVTIYLMLIPTAYFEPLIHTDER